MRLLRSFRGVGAVAVIAAAAVVFFSASSASGSALIFVTNTGDSGPGSLRQAIIDANSSSGSAIVFNIPPTDAGCGAGVCTIRPTEELPPLTAGATTIDGSTQGDTNPLGPPIVLNGALTSGNGLTLESDGNRVNDLVVDGFTSGGSGIEIRGSNNSITGSYVGLDATGSIAVQNRFQGISVLSGTGNVIGGSAPTDRDVVSGNNGQGIWLASSGNAVVGDFIGTDRTGTRAIGNGLEGVFIWPCPFGNCPGGPAQGNVIGGSVAGDGNVISGNSDGVWLEDSGNVVQGDFIGTDVTGTLSLPNLHDGVYVASAGQSQIGGTSVGARNVISGNGDSGIVLSGGAGSVVEANYIGTNAAGTAALGNGSDGVRAQDGASDVTIGGTAAGSGNLISGNGALFSPGPGSPNGVGIELGGVNGVSVEGNLIGSDASGMSALPNLAGGVSIDQDVSSAVIGGTTPAARNVISGNGFGVPDYCCGNGVNVGSSGTVILGNYIGTNAAGSAPLGNAGVGIGIAGDPAVANTVIGGTAPGAGNVISANRVGVDLPPWGLHPGNAGTTIQGNLIGTDATGSYAIGNSAAGIGTAAAVNLLVGGPAPGAGNVISGNGLGINLGRAVGAIVEGNKIGTNLVGAAVPNAGDGVDVEGSGNEVEANTIADNGNDGVAVFAVSSDPVVDDTISRNSIFSNVNLGIDLNGDGVTLNNCCGHQGPNLYENFPVLSSAVDSSSHLVVTGTIDTANPQTATLEFFANPVPVPGGNWSGYGEGAVFLGTATPAANGSFEVTFAAVAPGTLISATATDAAGNTSEFAKDVFASPASADQCKNGGWQAYGVFKNQGDCVSYVATGGKNPPADG